MDNMFKCQKCECNQFYFNGYFEESENNQLVKPTGSEVLEYRCKACGEIHRICVYPDQK